MSTELVPVEMREVQIGGETFTIDNVPEKSKLVTDAKKKILANIELDDLLSKLQMVGKLLFVAYNGVASEPALRGQVSTLQVNFSKLCAKSEQTMVAFGDNCDAILRQLSKIFTYLLSAKEDTALLFMSQMAKVAEAMANEANDLVKEFDAFSEDATKALAGAEVAKGTEEQKRAAYEQKRKEFEALTEGAKELVAEIAKQKEKLQKLYEEAKEAAEKHENRAFAMGLTGAIFGGIGQGLGAVGSIYAGANRIPPTLPAAPPATPPAQDKAVGAQAEADKAKEELDTATAEATKLEGEATEAKETAEKAKADLATLEADVTKAKEALTEAKTEQEAKEKELATAEEGKKADEIEAATKALATAKEAVTAAEKAVETAEGEVSAAKITDTKATQTAETKKSEAGIAKNKEKDAKKKYEKLAAALQGLGSALAGMGSGISKMGESYETIAASYNAEKVKYLDMLLKQQEEEGKALASIKEYAVRMQNLKGDVAVADVVIKALHQALGALKQIVVILSNTTDLWRQMARHCKNLSNSSKDLKDWMELEKPEVRVKLYLDSTFVQEGVRLYAGWKALHLVTVEYSAATAKVKREVQDNVVKNVSSDKMLQLAIEEGKALSLSADGGLAANQKETAAIKAEQQLKAETVTA